MTKRFLQKNVNMNRLWSDVFLLRHR